MSAPWNPDWSREDAGRAGRIAREDEEVAALREAYPDWSVRRALEPGRGRDGARRQGWAAARGEGTPVWVASIPELRTWLAAATGEPG